MKTIRLAAFLVLTLPRLASGDALEDPYARLAYFEGTWTVVGQEGTYRETCRWFENRRFLLCAAEDKEIGVPTWSMSIFGYSAERQAYTHTLLAPSGAMRSIHGWHDGKLWRFTGETQKAGVSTRSQVLITPTEAGFTFRLDTSTNGDAWQKAAEFNYVRLP